MWVRIDKQNIVTADATASTLRHSLLVHTHEFLTCTERSDLVSDPLELLHVLRAADRDRCAVVPDRGRYPVDIRLIRLRREKHRDTECTHVFRHPNMPMQNDEVVKSALRGVYSR